MTAKRDDDRHDDRHDLHGLDVFPRTEQMPATSTNPSDEYELFGDFGQYGFTPESTQAISPAEAAQWRQHFQTEQAAREQERRAAWEQAQQTRARILRKLDTYRRQRRISGVAYDLLQSEFSAGFIPDVYQDSVTGHWLVWSAYERCRYSLANWERKAQQALRVDDPDRETMRLTPPPPSHPWSPALNSNWPATPARPMRPTPRFWQSLPWRRATGQPVETPAGYRADYGDGFGAAAPATVPMLSDNEKRGLV